MSENIRQKTRITINESVGKATVSPRKKNKSPIPKASLKKRTFILNLAYRNEMLKIKLKTKRLIPKFTSIISTGLFKKYR
jgi:hypothetical protein